jgi:hypothetical protein
MLTGFPIGSDWKNRSIRSLIGATRWNQYVANWPIALGALRRLWENGKVSQLETPFFEPIEKPISK